MSKIRFDGIGNPVMLPTKEDVVTQAPVGILKDIIINQNTVAPGHLLQYTLTGPIVIAGAFVTARTYIIVSTGTTNFTLIGAADSNVGTTFTATGVGLGTGTASTPDPVWQNSNIIDGGTD